MKMKSLSALLLAGLLVVSLLSNVACKKDTESQSTAVTGNVAVTTDAKVEKK